MFWLVFVFEIDFLSLVPTFSLNPTREYKYMVTRQFYFTYLQGSFNTVDSLSISNTLYLELLSISNNFIGPFPLIPA